MNLLHQNKVLESCCMYMIRSRNNLEMSYLVIFPMFGLIAFRNIYKLCPTWRKQSCNNILYNRNILRTNSSRQHFILSLKSTRELSNCRPLEFVHSFQKYFHYKSTIVIWLLHISPSPSKAIFSLFTPLSIYLLAVEGTQHLLAAVIV